jgi:hypothetical protein
MSASPHSESLVFRVLADVANSLPLLPVWVFIAGLLVVAVVVSVSFVLVLRLARKHLHFTPKSRRRILIGAGVFLVTYAGFYLGTTAVRPQGHGGLTGPLKVRVFQSEGHLIVFYPLYLVERWIRNGLLDTAVYYFNVEFKDGRYPHTWLYGDGVYSSFW